VANAGSINATVGIAAPGSALNVVYLRDGREATTSLPVETLTEAPVVVGQAGVRAYGAALRDADGGAQVAAVEAGSPAAQAELAAGDIINAVAGTAVADARAAGAALQAASGSVEVSVTRNGEALTLALAL
jgi:S1-C subfamily serine protease